MTRKLVLCRPAGGLNDMLCQIGRVARYAKKYGRYAVIDTCFLSETFGDYLSYYFKSKSDCIILPSESDLIQLSSQNDVYPRCVQGKLNTYHCVWDESTDRFIENITKEPISFNFEKDYGENLLVHHGCGGGRDSLYALRLFGLQEHILISLSDRLRTIGRSYHGIHIRHSDYKTDYKEAIGSIRDHIKLPVFLATDSSEVLSYCKDILGRENVYSFSRFFSAADKALHYRIMNFEDTRLRNVDSILDLLTLALARKLYIFPLRAGSPEPYSGFSILAEALSQDPRLLYSLTGKINISQFFQGSLKRIKKNILPVVRRP